MQPVLTFLFYLGEKSRRSISWGSPLTVKANHSSRGCGQPWPKAAGRAPLPWGSARGQGGGNALSPTRTSRAAYRPATETCFPKRKPHPDGCVKSGNQATQSVKEQRGRHAIYQRHQWAQAGGGREAFPPFRPLPASANRLSNPPPQAPNPPKTTNS